MQGPPGLQHFLEQLVLLLLSGLGYGEGHREPSHRDGGLAADRTRPPCPGPRTSTPTALPTHGSSPLHSSRMLAGTLPRQPECQRVAILQSPSSTCEAWGAAAPSTPGRSPC